MSTLETIELSFNSSHRLNMKYSCLWLLPASRSQTNKKVGTTLVDLLFFIEIM